MSLRAAIDELTVKFADDVLRALRDASLQDLVVAESAPRAQPKPSPKPKKRIRRSPQELQRLADVIVEIVEKHPDGIKAEHLKRAMGVPAGNIGAKAFTKPLSFALRSKRITKRGVRRQTYYVALPRR